MKKWLKTIVFFLGFLAIWKGLILFFKLPDYLVPDPLQVGYVFVTDHSILISQTAVTLVEWIIGLLLSIILGFCIATLCFTSARIREWLYPFLLISQTIPYLAFAPLLLIWLGLGMAPKMVLVVLSCSFPIALAFEEGLTKGRLDYGAISSTLRFSPQKAFWNAYFPAALPSFFTGLKLCAAYAFVSTVMAELIGSEQGLGIYLTRAQASYRTDRVVAAVFLIVAVSIFTTGAVDRLRRRFIFWETAPSR